MQLFLTNARVVDGTGAPALEDATVVINGSTLDYVGAAANAPQPGAGDRVADVGGKTILPGLFNVHVHLSLRLPFTERRIDQFNVGYRTMLIYRRALEAIASGTTTVRCVGEPHFVDMDVRNAINKGVLAGPRILASFPESLAHKATGYLNLLGVQVRTDTFVTEVDASGVVAGGRRFDAATVLWAAGVAASTIG